MTFTEIMERENNPPERKTMHFSGAKISIWYNIVSYCIALYIIEYYYLLSYYDILLYSIIPKK